MSKTILVPTDFSKNAAHALNYAIDLAKHENAKLILFNAYNVDFAASYVPVNLIEQEVKEAEKKSQTHLKVLYTKVVHAGHIKCDCISVQGDAVDGILDAIKEHNADLVVMGTKGAGGLKGFLLGSNTASVMEKATCPVMAIPEDCTINQLKKITYASDYHNSDIEVLEKIVDLAKSYRAQINVLHIAHETRLTEEEKHKMEAFMVKAEKINYNNISFQILYGENTQQKLEDYLKDESTDLLVMSTQQRSFYEKLFAPSMTKNLAYQTKVPLMAFHYKKKETITIF